MHVNIKRLTFYDCRGILRTIRGCPITVLDEIREIYLLFWEEIASLDPTLEITLNEAIEKNPNVLQCANRLLELFGIKPEWCDLPLLGALIHSYTDAEDQPHSGYLWQMIFNRKPPAKLGDSGSEVLWDDFYAGILNALAHTEGGLGKAVEVASELPLDEVEGFLAARNEEARMQDEPDCLWNVLSRTEVQVRARMEGFRSNRSLHLWGWMCLVQSSASVRGVSVKKEVRNSEQERVY